ncbi:tetratricopeptide repeat protein [Winogradskyella sp. 3972H.M.0a.05]|uniref:tetratricopeptide repeat protein n=1 Tax=Winogradskyella sp. 3972H.M.0a.05 TaxID=2950277 RepID=UPI0033984F39
MRTVITVLLSLSVFISFSQEKKDKEKIKAEKKANNFIYEGNNLVDGDFVAAEMEYRKAISEQSNAAGTYNLAHSYYNKGNFEEALYRTQQAAILAKTKEEKHKAYHNIGNILMQNEMCKEAVEAFKNALRNDPTDDETRYNFALAKECAKDQGGGGEDENEDKKDQKDQNKEDQQKKEDENKDNKEQKKDQGEDKKEKGEEKEDENGKPKDEKKQDQKDEGKGDKEKKQQKPKPQPGKLSKQQIKNLLQAMNDKEQKVQEKMNAKKQKGQKIKTDKDW